MGSHTSHTVHMPATETSHAHLKSMLRYLQSAITKHAKITPQEQALMQSFFIKHGSALLSQLAQVDPDATWHSKGVVRQEQYEMDSQRPDRLSEEWGSKNLKSSTVVKDFVHDMLSPHSSKTHLMRPGAEQQALGSSEVCISFPYALLQMHRSLCTTSPQWTWANRTTTSRTNRKLRTMHMVR